MSGGISKCSGENTSECITLDSSQDDVESVKGKGHEPEGLLDEIYKLPLLDETHNGIMKSARCKALIPSS
jgi:hypothetical protein